MHYVPNHPARIEINKKTFENTLRIKQLSLYFMYSIFQTEKLYTCTFSTKSFTEGHHLKEHLRAHSEEKPYSCTLCTKSFTQSTHLK